MSNIDEQSEELRGGRGRKSGGASIEMRDSRMSGLVAIGLAVTPIAVVGIGAWIANSISTLNATVTRLVVQNEAINKRQDQGDIRNDRQDADINSLNQHVYVLEGKALRGVPFDQEARRGK